MDLRLGENAPCKPGACIRLHDDLGHLLPCHEIQREAPSKPRTAAGALHSRVRGRQSRTCIPAGLVDGASELQMVQAKSAASQIVLFAKDLARLVNGASGLQMVWGTSACAFCKRVSGLAFPCGHWKGPRRLLGVCPAQLA